jgi:hypothetical protein
MNEKQIKLASYVIGACTLLVILVLIIDLDTKNRLLKAAESLKEAINDGRIPATNNQGSGPDPDNNGSIPPDLVDNGNAGMATPSSNGHATRTSPAGESSARPDSRDFREGIATFD